MEWTTTLHEEKQYVEIVTSGAADRDGTLKMAKAIAETMRDAGIMNILIDHRNITTVSGSAVDAYQRSRQFREIGGIHGIMVAEIVRPEHQEFFNFLATVFINRGYAFSIFHDRESALKWLLKS